MCLFVHPSPTCGNPGVEWKLVQHFNMLQSCKNTVLGEGLIENSVATQANVWCTIQTAYGWMLCIDELMHEHNIEGNLICITFLDHA